MSTDEIGVFVEVVEAQSFTRAAARLGMPATTVSAKIARLEARLETTLIQRTTRRLHVTEAGRIYYAHCAQALAAIGDGERALAAARETPLGLLRLTAPADLAQRLLTPLIERFLAAHPSASVDLVVTNRKVDLVAEGIDLAVRAGPMADSSLIVRAFRPGRVALFAAASYVARRGMPATAADLVGHDFVRFSRAPARVPFRSSSGATVEVDMSNARLASDDLESVRGFILRGHGIGLLPDFLDDGQDGLVRVLDQLATAAAAVHFVYPAQKFVPRTVRAFMDLATEA